jgi:hypothetical protein
MEEARAGGGWRGASGAMETGKEELHEEER